MSPSEVLACKAKVLTDQQRESYFENGYLLLERAIPETWLERLRAADAFPYTYNPLQSRYDQHIVRGQRARWARHDPRPCLLPPDWSGGYTSIFALQQGEDPHAAD